MSFNIIDFGVNYGKNLTEDKLIHTLNKAADEGVTHVVSISNSLAEIQRNINNHAVLKDNINLKYYFTAGVHPHNGKELKAHKLEVIENCFRDHSPVCFAVGECGLDYNRMFSPKEDQIHAFHLQIELAKRLNKPLYLHCRDAFDDFIAILHQHSYYNGLIHCFTGNLDQALQFTNLGFKLGITGWLLDKRRNHELIGAISDPRITVDMLIAETDAPYLSIDRKRKARPEDVRVIIERIAQLKGIEKDLCAETIYQNSLKLLGII
jgi:TatD DNase family protein